MKSFRPPILYPLACPMLLSGFEIWTEESMVAARVITISILTVITAGCGATLRSLSKWRV